MFNNFATHKSNIIMKKVFSVFALLCMGILAMAQSEYKPILKEGRTWLVKFTYYGDPNDKYITYSVDNDTVIDGKTWKVVTRSDRPKDPLLAREENGVLTEYVMHDKRYEELMFDFNVQDGDTIYRERCPFWSEIYGRGEHEPFAIAMKDVVDAKGVQYDRFRSKNINFGNLLPQSAWVEGVGMKTNYAIMHTEMVDPSELYTLSACYDNGVCIFEAEDFDMSPTEIAVVKASAANPGTIYDLNGNIVTTPTSRNIYIQNGKKFIAK